MKMLLCAVLFLVVTFNYNLPILTKAYKGISKHRFREWLIFGWMTRVSLGLVSIYAYHIVRYWNPWIPSWALLVVFVVLAGANSWLTYFEIKRDRLRYYHIGLVDYDLDDDLPPFQLGLAAFKEMSGEVTSRVHATFRRLDNLLKDI